jgi:hypothetical protein
MRQHMELEEPFQVVRDEPTTHRVIYAYSLCRTRVNKICTPTIESHTQNFIPVLGYWSTPYNLYVASYFHFLFVLLLEYYEVLQY